MNKLNPNIKSQIDEIDLKVLAELMVDAKKPYAEIADKVCTSNGTVHVRIKKLEKLGVIKGSSLNINLDSLGYDITAFLGIYLEKSSMNDVVEAELQKIPEVLTLHYTTGQYSLFAKIICRDTNHLREVLHDKIQKIEGITSTETLISLKEQFTRPLQLI